MNQGFDILSDHYFADGFERAMVRFWIGLRLQPYNRKRFRHWYRQIARKL